MCKKKLLTDRKSTAYSPKFDLLVADSLLTNSSCIGNVSYQTISWLPINWWHLDPLVKRWIHTPSKNWTVLVRKKLIVPPYQLIASRCSTDEN